MRTLRSALAVASLTLALMAFPSASASHEVCGHDNQAVYEDVVDTLGGDRQCGTLTDPCFQDDSCPRSCGGGTDSPVTWLIGPIYCTASADAAGAPCTGPNEYVIWDVRDTLSDPTSPECGSLTDPCFVKNQCNGGCGGDGVVTWVIGPIYCTLASEGERQPGQPSNGCGPDAVERIVGPIYCV